jgi:hypothetical protein
VPGAQGSIGGVGDYLDWAGQLRAG